MEQSPDLSNGQSEKISSDLLDGVSAAAIGQTFDLLHQRHGSFNSLDGRESGDHTRAVSFVPRNEGLVDRDVSPLHEQLSHLIFAGNCVFGVVNLIGSEGERTETTLSLLPIGAQMQLDVPTSSRRFLRVDTAEAQKPRPNGVIRNWESAKIGRNEVTQAGYGIRDAHMSATHFEVMFSGAKDGVVEISDLGSLNGVEIVTMDDLIREPADSPLLDNLVNIVEYLKANPISWSLEYADKKVVAA